MSKPTLFLHIGMPKAASSSIQLSLAKNKEFIEKKGIYVNIDKKNRYHSRVLKKVYAKFFSEVTNNRFFNPDKYLEKDMRAFYEGSYSSMLLTHEGIFKYDPYVDYYRMLEWIKNKYDQFDIKIICYLRRQDLYVESWFNQLLKSGIKSPWSTIFYKVVSDWVGSAKYKVKQADRMTPFDYFLINFVSFTQYDEIIKLYADIFGKDNIIMRPLERCQLPNGPVYDFYANVLNFSDDEISMLKTSIVANQSFSRDLIEFITSSGISDAKLFSHVNTILNYDKMVNTYFTHEERKRFLAFHEEGNASLAREYLGREDGKLFYEEIKEYEPYPGLSLEKAVEIREMLVNALELKRGSYYLVSLFRNSEECNSQTTLNEVIETARKIYYSNADEALVDELITGLFDTFKNSNRPVVVYGTFGDLAEWILDRAVLYSKFVDIYLSDRRLGDMGSFLTLPVIEYKYIKELNPSAIIIAAATSGKEIRAALEKLKLEDTVIYPAYDFSDKAWSEFTAPLTTPDGYVNPYWEERRDD